MSESLPRRVFPAIVVALAIIVLTPTPLLADTYLPLVFYTAPLMVVGLIPVILIESFVLRRRLRLRWTPALRVTAWANFVSTGVGILGVYGLEPLGVHVYVGPWGNQAWLYLFLLILLVPLFLVSWWVEYVVVRLLLRPERLGSAVRSSEPVPLGSSPPAPSPILRSPISLVRGMFDANVASYLFLAMIVGVFLVQALLNPPPPNQAAAVGALRTLNTAEITYSSTYTTGFSPSLAALAPSATGGANPTAEAAGLIDSMLASGEKSGYRFVYSPGPRNEKGEITTYTITASPIKPGTGNFYYTDQSGVIRQNSTQPAAASDSPLAG